eukprot:1194247-Prorocentrum_minimum.AAC.4
MTFNAASEATPSFGSRPSESVRQPGPGFRHQYCGERLRVSAQLAEALVHGLCAWTNRSPSIRIHPAVGPLDRNIGCSGPAVAIPGARRGPRTRRWRSP